MEENKYLVKVVVDGKELVFNFKYFWQVEFLVYFTNFIVKLFLGDHSEGES